MRVEDHAGWRAHATVEKWDDDQVTWVEGQSGILQPPADVLRRYVAPAEVTEAAGNLLTTAGLTRLTSLLSGGGGQALTNTSTRIGVGDGGGTAAIGDTDLSASAGSTHRWFQVMNATYPTVSGGVLTAQSTWASGDGNFAWAEWGIDVAAPTVTASATVGACLLNHKTSASLGTKSGGTWTLTATVTIT